MSEKFPGLSAEGWEEQLQAEQRLAEMDLFEDLALLAEEEDCTAIRKQMANRYRNLIGVWPVHRDEFRLGLERLKAAGGMLPRDLADEIEREHQQNGSTLRTGSPSFSGTTGKDSTGVL